MFSSFGPDTLKELRVAWQAVDDYNHVNAFLDMHDVGDALMRAGFVTPVMDVEDITLTYNDIMTLMRELKAIGAHNVTAGRPGGLMGRRRLKQLADAYEQFRHDDRLPVTYEVVYGHAWHLAQQDHKQLPGGMTKVSVDAIQRHP
jgi:malonyl-CoA O-methyltransferase